MLQATGRSGPRSCTGPSNQVRCPIRPLSVTSHDELYVLNTHYHIAREADVERNRILNLFDVVIRERDAERLDVREQVLDLAPANDGEDVRRLL